jgi:cephalosporin hydroxylase
VVALAVATTYVAVNGVPYDDARIVDSFTTLALENQIHFSKYRNAPCIQFPTDQWMMQEIIFEVEPDYIIETGTWYGATALYYADLLEKVKPEGRVITIDIEPFHDEINVAEMWGERVEFILGSSTDPAVVARIADEVAGSTVLVTLDSDHSTDHVLRELELYAPLVSVGSYIVVQDTFLDHDAWQPGREGDQGPLEAVRRFLAADPGFCADRSRSRYLLTQHPLGYLKRMR